MSSFVRWYLHKLKTYPIYTNISSALVLMTVGDIMAQGLEHHHLGDKFAGKGHTADINEDDTIPRTLKRHISLRRYGTHGRELFPEDVAIPDKRQLRDDDDNFKPINLKMGFQDILYNALEDEFTFLDPFRLTTMVLWNVGVTTPAFMAFYSCCDRLFLGKPTPLTVGTRVIMTLVFSVPINAMFFTYGTCVHHAAAWSASRDEWNQEIGDVTKSVDQGPTADELRHLSLPPPFDWEAMWSKVHLKVTTELPTTMFNSAGVWVPVNVVNFALVPPHLRPLLMMVCSVFWNCYLSIVQHRVPVFVASSSSTYLC
jgi:hypothetical protein